MKSNRLIPVATTHIFVNVPKHLHHSLSSELLEDVKQQVISQYETRFKLSHIASYGLSVSQVSARQGCVIVEITIAASVTVIPAVLVAIKDYKAFKESLFEIGKDVKQIWFKAKYLKVTKPACVMKIDLEERAAIEAAIEQLEHRNNESN